MPLEHAYNEVIKSLIMIDKNISKETSRIVSLNRVRNELSLIKEALEYSRATLKINIVGRIIHTKTPVYNGGYTSILESIGNEVYNNPVKYNIKNIILPENCGLKSIYLDPPSCII